MTALRSSLPIDLDRIITKTLAKEPAERYQHVEEFKTDLRTLVRQVGVAQPRAKTTPPLQRTPVDTPPWKRYAPWAIAAVLGVTLLFRGQAPQPPPARQTKFVIQIPPEQRLTGSADYPFDVSPSGDKLVYAAESGGVTRLYLRPIDAFDAAALPGTEGSRYPFFSPDSRWVGFFSGQQLLKVAISGGAPIASRDPSAAHARRHPSAMGSAVSRDASPAAAETIRSAAISRCPTSAAMSM